MVIEDIRIAGTAHWLIMPTRHVRDIEVLGSEDLPMRTPSTLPKCSCTAAYSHFPA